MRLGHGVPLCGIQSFSAYNFRLVKTSGFTPLSPVRFRGVFRIGDPNDRGVRTARGGQWNAATVRNLLLRAQ
jgi:hypothetical protein